MSFVFISYAIEDTSIARKLAGALEKLGLEVWWGRDLVPGSNYHEVIARKLGEANWIIVIWARLSVSSRWVIEEAKHGLEQETLIPVRIDDTRLPLPFGSVHTESLEGWDGDPDHAGFRRVANVALGRPVRLPHDPPPEESALDRRLAALARKWKLAALASVSTVSAAVYVLRPPSEMVFVPSGIFQIGNLSGAAERDFAELAPALSPILTEPEQPEHGVTLPDFYIDRFEVSVGDFRRFLAANPHRAPPPSLGEAPDDHPIHGVSWEDAEAYCESVGKRLPTEAEWEKAARGNRPDDRRYPWGNEAVDGTRANYSAKECDDDVEEENGFVRTAPVGSFPRGQSPYGVHDLAGNVSEWVEDDYDADRNLQLRAGDLAPAPLPTCPRRMVFLPIPRCVLTQALRGASNQRLAQQPGPLLDGFSIDDSVPSVIRLARLAYCTPRACTPA